MPHICVNIGSDYGLSPIRCQAITFTNVGLFSIRFLGTKFYYFLSRQFIWICHLPKWWPFCPGRDELTWLRLHIHVFLSTSTLISEYVWYIFSPFWEWVWDISVEHSPLASQEYQQPWYWPGPGKIKGSCLDEGWLCWYMPSHWVRIENANIFDCLKIKSRMTRVSLIVSKCFVACLFVVQYTYLWYNNRFSRHLYHNTYMYLRIYQWVLYSLQTSWNCPLTLYMLLNDCSKYKRFIFIF